MRNLFEIGLNDGGFFVFPFNSPPQYQSTGDEVGLQQAIDLRDSLNRSVSAYIADQAKDGPKELLSAIAQHWSWKSVLSLIADLIWKEAWDKREESYSVFRRFNSQALGRIVRDWK